MKLLPKNIDIRGILKELLSSSSGKTPLHLAHLREKVRLLIGEQLLKEKHLMKTDIYYLKLGEFLGCGKNGVLELDASGKKRYMPLHCQSSRMCLECFGQKKRRQQQETYERIMAIVEANNVQFLQFAVYTLHPEIRHEIVTRIDAGDYEILNEVNKLVVDTFKESIGMGSRWGRDITGIISVMHPFGSRKPFEPFLHFHLIRIPLNITKDGRVERASPWIEADDARRLWQKAQVQFAEKHGITLAGSETNLKLKYIPTFKKGHIRHRIKYDLRSLLDDIFLSARYVTKDFDSFLWLENVGSDWRAHIDKWDVFERAVKRYMSFPVQVSRSYGYMRDLKKHSEILGIARVESSPDFIPVKSIPCLFRRSRTRFENRIIGKWVFRVVIEVKYGELDWHKVPLEEVVGEGFPSQKKYRWARAP
ncbi:hypothetical protein ES703_79150 [subsurface metagenome]